MVRRGWFAVLGVCAAMMPVPTHASAAETMCHDAPSFTIVSREREGSVGSDIFIRRKTKPGAAPACKYDPSADDFTLGQDEPYYFLAVRDRFLLLESSTSPDTWLVIFDAVGHRKMLDVQYDDARGLGPHAAGFTFWQIVGGSIQPTACPESWRKDPANKELMDRREATVHATKQMIFSFAEGTARAIGEASCAHTQDDM